MCHSDTERAATAGQKAGEAMGTKASRCLVCGTALEFDAGELFAAERLTDVLAPVCVGRCLARVVASRGGLALRPELPERAILDPGRVVVTARAVAALVAAGQSVEEVLRRRAD